MNKSLRTHLNVRSLYESLFSCLIAVFLLASCQSYKKVPYLQDAGVVKDINQQENLYDAKIMPKDLLTIVVSCTSPELAVPFNLTVATPANAATASTQLTTQPVLQPYLVDNEGKINFPVLGELKVGGLTKREAEQLIIEKLKPYIKETPIVTVRMVNYKISVLGEVARPGTFTISNEKVNLLEALAMAGVQFKRLGRKENSVSLTNSKIPSTHHFTYSRHSSPCNFIDAIVVSRHCSDCSNVLITSLQRISFLLYPAFNLSPTCSV